MRPMLVRCVLAAALLTTLPVVAFAQLQYVKAPISIENAVLVPPGVSSEQGIPVPVPVSEFVDLSQTVNCLIECYDSMTL